MSVNYQEVREQFKTGDLAIWSADLHGLSRHSIETGLVRVGTASRFSHVGVLWVDHGRIFVMDLTRRGCAPRPLSKDLPFLWIPAPRPLSENALEAAFSMFGELTYTSNLEALWDFLTGNDTLDRQGQCSSYARWIYDIDGYDVEGVPATPQGMFDWAMAAWPSAAPQLVVNI